MNPSEAVGALVREAREKLGISMSKAARRALVSESRWRQIEKGFQQKEKGVRTPTKSTPQTLAQVARAVGLEPEQLWEAAGVTPEAAEAIPSMPPNAILARGDFSERERQLLGVFLDWAHEQGRREGLAQASS